MLRDAAGWGLFPAARSITGGPLGFDICRALETPPVQYVGDGVVTTPRYWGLPAGTITYAQAYPWIYGDYSWGLSRYGGTPSVVDSETYTDPTSIGERIQRFDRQRCVNVASSDIVETGVAFELGRFQVGANTIGVIERVPTTWTVTALDDAGDPLFVYGDNGALPCVDELIHPDPTVTVPLTWRFRIVRTGGAWWGSDIPPVASGIAPGEISGVDVCTPWRDLRYGAAASWGDEQKILVQPESFVRFFVEIYGTPARWRISGLGGRLSGYTCLAGNRQASVYAVTRRW